MSDIEVVPYTQKKIAPLWIKILFWLMFFWVFVSFIFTVILNHMNLKPAVYDVAFWSSAVLFWVGPARIFFKNKGNEIQFCLNLFGALLAMMFFYLVFGVSTIRLIHFVSPKEVGELNLTVVGKGRCGGGRRSHRVGVDFEELPGFFNEGACGLPPDWLKRVQLGDVFEYEVNESYLGYDLKFLKRVTRAGETIYLR
jgi:hypothetical protein